MVKPEKTELWILIREKPNPKKPTAEPDRTSPVFFVRAVWGFGPESVRYNVHPYFPLHDPTPYRKSNR